MAAVKHEISIHIRLSDEADAVLELMSEAKEITKIKIVEDLVHRALLGEGHALKVAAIRYSRLGLARIDTASALIAEKEKPAGQRALTLLLAV